jgi:hypothetical protein
MLFPHSLRSKILAAISFVTIHKSYRGVVIMLFEGLYSYEIVLMILGFLLFLACLCIFVARSIKNQSPKNLLPFFLVAIVCIGYPSIQKISYENGKISIDKAARDIVENKEAPSQKAISNLNAGLRSLESSNRPIKDKGILTSIAEAKLKIGEVGEADKYVGRALAIDPNFQKAQGLRRILRLPSGIAIPHPTPAPGPQPQPPVDPAGPDLKVSKVEIRNPAPPFHAGNDLQVLCSVESKGYGGPYNALFFVDGNQIHEMKIPSVNLGATYRWKATPGIHTITAMVDPVIHVPETDTINNRQSIVIHVQ